VGIQVSTYIKTPIIRKWSNDIAQSLDGLIDCQTFASFQVLIKKLIEMDKQKKTDHVILLDVENELFQEYINQLKTYSLCFKLMACGFPKPSNDIKNLFKIGIKGFVDITNSELDFLKALKAVSNDNYYLPSSAINEIIVDLITETSNQMATTNRSAVIVNKHKVDELLTNYKLSEKEKSVVGYLLVGYSYKQIAEIIGITAFAINQRTKSVYKKCGVKSRNELSYLLLNK
jgi:DNA-binding NarL/FixJ family response regulator